MASGTEMSTALVPIVRPEEKPAKAPSPVDLLMARYEKVQRRDLDIVDGMNRFAEIPTELEELPREQMKLLLAAGTDAQIKGAGWRSRQQLRAAFYGTLPRSKWPAAMQAAHERVGMRLRKQEKNIQRQTFNLNVISIPAPQRPDADQKIVIVEAKEQG